jgi:hypothetical protein
VDARSDQAARRLAEVAAAVRETARRLAMVEGVAWSSLAAERFRAELAEVAAHVARAADGADEASAALHRHAASAGGVHVPLPWPGHRAW